MGAPAYRVVGYMLDGDVRVDRTPGCYPGSFDVIVLAVSSADRPVDERHARVAGSELRLTVEGANELIALLQRAIDS